jgi:hypothetical protein
MDRLAFGLYFVFVFLIFEAFVVAKPRRARSAPRRMFSSGGLGKNQKRLRHSAGDPYWVPLILSC